MSEQDNKLLPKLYEWIYTENNLSNTKPKKFNIQFVISCLASHKMFLFPGVYFCNCFVIDNIVLTNDTIFIRLEGFIK